MIRRVTWLAAAAACVAIAAFGSSETIVFSPQAPGVGQRVTATISGLAKSPAVRVDGVTITGNTITIDASVVNGAVCGPACFYATEATFTAPSQPGVYRVDYWLTFVGTRTLSATVPLVVANVCDFGHSLTAGNAGAYVGGFGVGLTWCNPGYSLTDFGYFVRFYRIYQSHSAAGPFTPLRDVQGATSTSTGVELTSLGPTFYYVEAHGCMGVVTTCTTGSADTTITSNIVSVNGTLLGLCLSDEKTLCLEDGRFAVTAHWHAPDGRDGDAHPIALTRDSGGFWFFDSSNIEVTTKILDACALQPASFWIFASGMTNVGVDLTVTDMQTKVTHQYKNALGTPFTPIIDTNTFSCP